MNKKKLKNAIKKSINYSEVSNIIYGNNNYGNRITIKKYINLYNIDISHFTFSSRRKNIFFEKRNINDILVTGSTFNTTNLKNKLYKEGLKKRKCELCEQGEEWMGKKMSLILDHINGINNDNRIENLRIVCPNCNATLPTHGGKNLKKIHNKREKKYYKIKTEKEKLTNKINLSLKQRKVKRPSYDELKKSIKLFGYLETGRKYKVSDNAIRKWVKFYKKYGQ